MKFSVQFQIQKTPLTSQPRCCSEMATFIFVPSQICKKAETAYGAVSIKILNKCT